MKGYLMRNNETVGMYRENDGVVSVMYKDDLGTQHGATFHTVVAFETWADYHEMEVC